MKRADLLLIAVGLALVASSASADDFNVGKQNRRFFASVHGRKAIMNPALIVGPSEELVEILDRAGVPKQQNIEEGQWHGKHVFASASVIAGAISYGVTFDLEHRNEAGITINKTTGKGVELMIHGEAATELMDYMRKAGFQKEFRPGSQMPLGVSTTESSYVTCTEPVVPHPVATCTIRNSNVR